MSQTVSVPLRKLLVLALLGGLGGGLFGCSSTAAAPPVDGGLGLVPGPADDHCVGVDPILVSQASCHPPADAGAPVDPGDGGEPVPPIHVNGESDDDDCKYHVVFTTTPVLANQNLTFHVTVTKLAENNVPATGGDVTIESYFADDPLHPIPNNGTKTTEVPPNSGIYTVTPVKFDKVGRWVVRFHFYERCEDLLEDSPHGHVAFYFDVP